MKNILDFGNFELQYWIDEFPTMSEVSTDAISEIICGLTNINSVKTCKICVELFLHKDANNYGLLGMEFIPQRDAEKLEIQIKYTKENTEHFQSKIKRYDNMLYYGLCEEYVSYLKSRLIDKIHSKDEFYCGSLIISIAANSMVGSSPMIFGVIANIIIEMFLMLQKERIRNIDDHIREIVLREYNAVMGSNSTNSNEGK